MFFSSKIRAKRGGGGGSYHITPSSALPFLLTATSLSRSSHRTKCYAGVVTRASFSSGSGASENGWTCSLTISCRWCRADYGSGLARTPRSSGLAWLRKLMQSKFKIFKSMQMLYNLCHDCTFEVDPRTGPFIYAGNPPATDWFPLWMVGDGEFGVFFALPVLYAGKIPCTNGQ